MIHTLQTTNFNCGSACLATILETTVEDVEERLLRRTVGELLDPDVEPGGPPQIGVSSYEIQCVLWDHGYRVLPLASPFSETPSTWYDRVGEDLPVIDFMGRIDGHMDRGGSAILAVPSLFNEGAQHWIVATGNSLLDPNGTDGRVYRCVADFSPEWPLRIYEALLIEGPCGCR